MIATLAEIKAFLQITATTHDTLMQTYIPIVENDIFDYCNNRFVAIDSNYNNLISYSAQTFVFAADGTITDSDSGFVTAGFVTGDNINITGTKRNNGNFTASTVAAGTITIDSLETFVAEDQGTNTTPEIALVQYPKSLKPIVAQMVGYYVYNINTERGNITSETLGQYSVSYSKRLETVGANMYPTNIISGLSAYKYVRFA